MERLRLIQNRWQRRIDAAMWVAIAVVVGLTMVQLSVTVCILRADLPWAVEDMAHAVRGVIE